MSVPGTAFNGPVISGDKRSADDSGPANTGFSVLSQTALLTHNTTNAVSAHFALPAGSQIEDILIDNLIVWNSATSDTLSVGKTAGGTEYASGVDTKAAAGRLAPTLTAAQLTAMANIGSNTDVYATVTPVGSSTTGSTRVTIRYVQTLN